MNPRNLLESFPGTENGVSMTANTPKVAYFGFKDKILLIYAHICKVSSTFKIYRALVGPWILAGKCF
jgi:hypothetical protein